MQVDSHLACPEARGQLTHPMPRMNHSPKFSKVDADRILKRAAEIEGSEDHVPISVDELRSIAGEAGFGARAVERAIAEAQQAATLEVRRHPVTRSGLVITRLSTVRTIPVEISSDQLHDAVRLFQPYREGPAHVNLGEHRITWRDRKGLRFTVTSGGGVSEIRVSCAKVLVRKGRWMGWVKYAADRLERLLILAATQESVGLPRLPSPLPGLNSTGHGSER